MVGRPRPNSLLAWFLAAAEGFAFLSHFARSKCVFCILLFSAPPSACATVPLNSNFSVACTSSSQFPANFTVMLTATAGDAACPVRNDTSVVATTICCSQGPAYGMHNDASKTLCLGCTDFAAFVNSIATPASTTDFPMVVGGDCVSTVSTVGRASVSCANVFGNVYADITIGIGSYEQGTFTTTFWVGCKSRPDGASGCLYSLPGFPSSGTFGVSACQLDSFNPSTSPCSGTLVAGQTRKIRLGCSCNNDMFGSNSVHWVIASVPATGSSFSPPRVNDACP